jgi:tetratricopeptide (TPR) repeat protein
MDFDELIERGQTRLRAGDIEGAIDDFSEASAAMPKDPTAWSCRGYAKARKNDLGGAIKDLQEALKIAPPEWSGRASAVATLERLEPELLVMPTAQREFAERAKYRALTKETIAAIADKWLEQAVIDWVMDYNIRGQFGRQAEIVRPLPGPIRQIYAAWVARTQAVRVGFDNFLTGPSGILAIDAVEGFKRAGAHKHQAALQKALAALTGLTEGWTPDAFAAAAKEWKSKGDPLLLEEADRQMADPKEDASALASKHIRQHADEFVTP